MDERERMKNIEKAIDGFWKDYGKPMGVAANNNFVSITPRFIVGNRINPDVAKRILSVYLSQLTSDKIVKEEIKIDGSSLKIFDHGEVILSINNEKIVDSMGNKVTDKMGRELAKRESKEGGKYVTEKDSYTFGEIKEALVQFMKDATKNDSKNMLKDAVLLLVK